MHMLGRFNPILARIICYYQNGPYSATISSTINAPNEWLTIQHKKWQKLPGKLRKVITATPFTEHSSGSLLRRAEIEQAVATGEIIEDYPQHHYSPACLVMGRTAQGKVLHILFGTKPMVSIVTVYEPEPSEWEPDWKVRRKRS